MQYSDELEGSKSRDYFAEVPDNCRLKPDDTAKLRVMVKLRRQH